MKETEPHPERKEPEEEPGTGAREHRDFIRTQH